MSDDLKVEFEGLETAVARLAESRTRIEKVLAALDSRASTLRGQWTGEASDAYDRAHTNLAKGMRDLNTILGAASTALDKANAGFRQAEKANAGRWP
jgi:WXG100 family type VII secretion target